MTSLALNNPDAIARARPFSRYAVIAVAAVVMTGLLLQWRPAALTDTMHSALQASLVIALAAGVGAVPALIIRHWTAVLRDSLMGFSAGVMLFVVSHEVIPESHREGNETAATFALMGGFVMMLILTTLLA